MGHGEAADHGEAPDDQNDGDGDGDDDDDNGHDDRDGDESDKHDPREEQDEEEEEDEEDDDSAAGGNQGAADSDVELVLQDSNEAGDSAKGDKCALADQSCSQVSNGWLGKAYMSPALQDHVTDESGARSPFEVRKLRKETAEQLVPVDPDENESSTDAYHTPSLEDQDSLSEAELHCRMSGTRRLSTPNQVRMISSTGRL